MRLIEVAVLCGDLSDRRTSKSRLIQKYFFCAAEQEVALAEELDFIKGYVEIEQMRLGERLQVKWEIAPRRFRSKCPA